MSTGWEEKDEVPACAAVDPEGLPCVLASGHAGDHQLQSGSYFRLAVPNDGAVTVDTKIRALEEPEPGGRRRGCLGFGGLLIAVVIVIALTLRRAGTRSV